MKREEYIPDEAVVKRANAAVKIELEKKKALDIFAGPNGSGKSTFTELLKPPMDYINADEIKKNLKCSDLEVAQLAEKQREEHIEQMNEFCFETVLSTERNLRLLERAKERP